MVKDWFAAFVFTQLLEVPIYYAALGRREGARESPLWRAGFAFLASMATHPYVWFVIPSLFYSRAWDTLTLSWPWLDDWRYWLFFAAAEIFAVVAEGFLLWGLRVPRPFLWALAANAFSAFSGLAMRKIGWFL